MPKNSLAALPEAFVSDTRLSKTVSRAVAAGELRPLGSKVYTSNLVDPPESVVRRNLWQLVGQLVPGALIADRTALENRPAADGSLFVVSDRRRDIALPGLLIRPRPGAAATADDKPFLNGLRLSSQARAFLDNMAPSRSRGAAARTLSRAEIEERLDDIARRGGETALNRLRDDARRTAPAIGREDEFAELDRLIGALLGTKQARLESARARSRAIGTAYDPDRLALFELLHRELRSTALTGRPEPVLDQGGLASLAFYEAYFSNFIEGTEFEIDEARGIVFDNRIPAARPADAHDILGTWQIVSSLAEMRRVPVGFDDLILLLETRHSLMMGGRPDKRPGEFKELPNRAGNTPFVAPNLIRGTLEQGLALRHSLETPLGRAIYMMFLISEVHPFDDGNGRIARIMMNAELVGGGEARIIIPTIYRNNYLAALRALTRTANPEPLVRTLDFAQRWTAAMPWSADDHLTRSALERGNALLDPGEAEELGRRLRIP